LVVLLFLLLSSSSSSSSSSSGLVVVDVGWMDETAVLGGTFPSNNNAGFSNDLARFGGLPGPRLIGGDNDNDVDDGVRDVVGPSVRLVAAGADDDDPTEELELLLFCSCFLFLLLFPFFATAFDIDPDDEDDGDGDGAVSSLAVKLADGPDGPYTNCPRYRFVVKVFGLSSV
jgi:hypothetical protein